MFRFYVCYRTLIRNWRKRDCSRIRRLRGDVGQFIYWTCVHENLLLQGQQEVAIRLDRAPLVWLRHDGGWFRPTVVTWAAPDTKRPTDHFSHWTPVMKISRCRGSERWQAPCLQLLLPQPFPTSLRLRLRPLLRQKARYF